MISLDDIVEYAKGPNTKLTAKALEMDGMSSRNVRNLLNKVCSIDNLRYLEIGTWKGSTLYSALVGNSPEYALAIDNFSNNLFGGRSIKNIFFENMKDVGVNFDFLDEDCFKVDISNLKSKFNVYFYDGEHSFEDQQRALTHYYDVLDDTFIYICDDYNPEHVQAGTKSGIEKANLKIVEERKLFSAKNGDTSSWWNGIYIAILKK